MMKKNKKESSVYKPDISCHIIAPILGVKYQVIDNSGELHNAILQSKRTNERKNGLCEYFVHYENTNRRLDQWISFDHIIGETCDIPEGSSSGQENEIVISRSSRRTRNATNSDKTDEYRAVENELKSEPFAIDEEIDDHYIKMELEHIKRTKIKYIELIQFGNFEIACWYYSPFPEPFQFEPKLYICEYCLSYMKQEECFVYHLYSCKDKRPPGPVIYSKNAIKVYDVNSTEEKLYCQKLCLMAKLFLDHKTVHYDVVPYYFYIVTQIEEDNEHFVGYFSKEIDSYNNYNLNCLLVLPPYQKLGYGKFIISLSYELSKRCGVLGSPERPLSDLGLRVYESYWRWSILQVLNTAERNSLLPVKEICKITGFSRSDTVGVLQKMDLLTYLKGKDFALIEETQIATEIENCVTPNLLVDPEILKYEPRNPTEKER